MHQRRAVRAVTIVVLISRPRSFARWCFSLSHGFGNHGLDGRVPVTTRHRARGTQAVGADATTATPTGAATRTTTRRAPLLSKRTMLLPESESPTARRFAEDEEVGQEVHRSVCRTRTTERALSGRRAVAIPWDIPIGDAPGESRRGGPVRSYVRRASSCISCNSTKAISSLRF